jgi:hypothetical protein
MVPALDAKIACDRAVFAIKSTAWALDNGFIFLARVFYMLELSLVI